MICKKSLKFLGEGRTRRVYLAHSGKYVVKYPLNSTGEHANWQEAKDYKKGGFLEKENLARCRLATLRGKEVLIMEKVEPTNKFNKEGNSWVDYIDCQQVGYNRKGKLVAYDWAITR